MSFTAELRARHHGLWERAVTHPFVVEMGDGTLPVSKFQTYFLQDYLFVGALGAMVGLAIDKAPDIASARLRHFLSSEGDPEESIFTRAFREWGVGEEEYSSISASPTARAFSDFLVRVGYEGTFEDIITVYYVVEGVYLDWGTRLLTAGMRPDNPVYREWIDLHGPKVLGSLVQWMADHLDAADLASRRSRMDELFLSTLRYEYLFFESAYRGERWPDG